MVYVDRMRNGIIGASLAIAGLVVPLGAAVDANEPFTAPTVERAAYVSSDSSRCVSAPGGSAGDVAVVNITNTAATGGGYGALRASGTTAVFNRPSAEQFSSVNFAANTPANPNLAMVTIGSDGQFCYDGAVADHHVILDLAAIIPAANINAIDPTRILDTRSGARLSADSSRCVSAPGGSAGDVAVVNITNTAATGGGYGALRASGTTAVFNRPSAEQFSSVNFAANTPANPNLAMVTIGSDGQFCYDGAVADHHVILDLAAIIPAANINAIDPTRILDTRGEADPPAPCDPSYPSICIPPPPPQLSCDDIGVKDFPVQGEDPHNFDADNNGVGCETTTTQPLPDPRAGCSPSYPDVCIAPGPPDLDCSDIPFKNIRVVAPDEHNLDGNNDGVGCVS